MAAEAMVACIVCGDTLHNAFDQSENQPSGGTAFETTGHYGSTTFDPMDGSYIEINVCDPCLLKARDQKRVLWSRKSKVVVCEGTIVGYCKTPDRPLMLWTGEEGSGLDEDEDAAEERLEIEREDLCNFELYPEITWNTGAWLMKEDEKT